jgi:hypothetical protein
MANSDDKPSILPLANIASLVVLIGGIAFYLAPLTSSRPSAEPDHEVTAWGEQDVDARLWQDPLEASDRHIDELLRRRAQGELPEPAEAHAHDMATVRGELASAGKSEKCVAGQPCLPRILAVMVPGLPYAEDVERRLRTRHAVVEGLSASDFTPKDYLHIGYFELRWPSDAKELNSYIAVPAAARTLLVPYEWYEHRPYGGSVDADLLVLWLRDDAFTNNAPLTRLAWLLGALKGTIQPFGPSPVADADGEMPAAIIGPVTSNGLRAILEDNVRPEFRAALHETEVYSASASVSDSELASEPKVCSYDDVLSAIPDLDSRMSDRLGGTIPGFHLHRTILQDPDLMRELVAELQRRYVWSSPPAHIVLLAQLDTVYGRSLPEAFSLAVEDPSLTGDRPVRIETFFYPEGIDGKVPTADKQDSTQAKPKVQQDQVDERPREATEGADQSDYLRRLADALQEEDADERSRLEGGIRAVGVLGADVFDKIMILRALRASLPDAVFFTNSIDARLAHPSEWDATHNLVVASAFGLQLDAFQHAGAYLPFRDSYETSAFAATLQAMHRDVPPPRVHLYEIGLHGALPLDETQGLPLADWAALRRWSLVGVVLFAAVLGGCGVARSDWNRHAKRNDRLDYVAEAAFLVLAGIIMVWLIVQAQSHVVGGEPMAMVDGVSIWASEELRLLVGILGIHFIWRSKRQIEICDRQIAERFHVKEPFTRAHIASPDGVPFAKTWRKYAALGTFRRRFGRTFVPAVIYILFSWSLMFVLGPPGTPARGTFARDVNLFITVGFTVPVTILLLFFVIDAMLLNKGFVDRIMKSPTLWPNRLLADYSPTIVDPKVDICVAELLDIKVIAERTAVIEPLIYYPFILLALMILSRLHYFDDWDLPLSLSIVFLLNAIGAVFAALTLRHSAETARGQALENLRRWLFEASIEKEGAGQTQSTAAAGRAAAAKQAIDEIKVVRSGAFGSFAENPVLGALLLPGGAGLIAVVQYLLVPH